MSVGETVDLPARRWPLQGRFMKAERGPGKPGYPPAVQGAGTIPPFRADRGSQRLPVDHRGPPQWPVPDARTAMPH
jgi:hypothetical protein